MNLLQIRNKSQRSGIFAGQQLQEGDRRLGEERRVMSGHACFVGCVGHSIIQARDNE